MASDPEADGISLNGDCDYDDDDAAFSPMSSLLVPEIALSDGNFDDEAIDASDHTIDALHINGGGSGGGGSDGGDGGDRSYKCDVCAKVFKRKAHLRRHYRLHTGKHFETFFTEVPPVGWIKGSIHLVIASSNLIFFPFSSLFIRTGERPYDCSVCGQSFARSEQRNQHIAREHSKLNGITCTICNKAFSNDEERMNHMILHLENRYFRCTQCPKEFHDASGLTAHMQVNHSSEPINVTKKSYRCATCDMEFSRFDHLIRHQTVHSGVKQHQVSGLIVLHFDDILQ